MGKVTGRKEEQGLTLVELMIVVGLLGLVVTAMYNMFTFQQKSYTVQDNVAVMQQNVRVGLEYMVREIRMAGYIPEGIPPNNSAPTTDVSGGDSESIEEATAHAITFQADVDGDDHTETVRYVLQYDAGQNTTNLTKEVWQWDEGTTSWGASAGPQIVAENIDNIVFTYNLLADDQGLDNDIDDDGNDGADEDGELMTWDFGTDGALYTNQLRSFIRQINVTMTARTDNPDADYTHPDYEGATTAEEKALSHYRRRTLTSNVNLRNM